MLSVLSLTGSGYFTVLIGTSILFVLLLPIWTLAFSTMNFNATINRDGKGIPPPTVPYSIPIVAHLFGLIWSPVDFVMKTLSQYGWERPLQIRLGHFQVTIVSNPAHIATIFRSSKQLTSKTAALFSLKYLLNTPPSSISFYDADNSGMATTPARGSTVEHVNRIHFHQARTAQRFLSSQHLLSLSQRYADTLNRNLQGLDKCHNGNWVEYNDLYHFLQVQVARAAIETLMGSKILEMNPDLIEDFWRFDTNVPNFLRCFPRWMIPSAYRARERLIANIKQWHAYAHANTDCSKVEDDDPEWEPYFGSKLIRARQSYSVKMKPMNADARASEDLGLLMAANGNAVPSIFWFLYETLENENLQQRLMSEVSSCTSSAGIDISALLAQPLLQSTYAEVLRLRVAIAMTRVSESEAFQLGGYKIPAGQPFIIFSRPPALNREAWALAGREHAIKAPLDEFHADRFLIPPLPSTEQKTQQEAYAIRPIGAKAEFSLEGLAGCWIPYGGGQRMCPGRHFAKAEMISTVALLLSQYDIQVLPTGPSRAKPDLRWFPVGALPPAGKVPFRMRKKVP
ncbi:cytochrome P450 [Xylaria longipes]|nr:cytochrome P450 [Xylaria longipes]